MSTITKQKQTKNQITLLQAIETLAESSRDSKLSSDYMKSVKNETKFLAKQYGITERQAVLFAVCMDEGPNNVDYRDIASHLDINRIGVLALASDIDALVHRRILRYRDVKDGDSFNVSVAVIRCLKRNEEIADDRFAVEHFPLNRKYGFCRSRQSKVTIICPTSNVEVGIGWFTYYLSLMGGFNYISKEIEADSNEPDSYFNYSPEPFYKGQPRSAYGEHDKEALAMLDKKQKLRAEFESDLKAAAQAEWVIVVAEQLKTSNNQVDFHFNDCRKDGSDPTVADQEAYQRFRDGFARLMSDEFGLSTMNRSPRYLLLKKNIGYTIRKDNPNVNVFVLRPSSELMNFNTNKLAIAYEMARLISEHFDNSRGPRPEDIDEMKQGGFGYPTY